MVQVATLSAKVTADTIAAEKNLGGVQGSLLKTGAAFDQTGARANRMRLITLQVAETQAKLSAETDELRRAMLKVKLDDLTRQYRGLAEAQSGAATKTQGLGAQLMAVKGPIMLASAAVVGFGVAAKKAFDFAAEGAAVEQTIVSFERLGVSMHSLREAANGTMSDMDIMAATNKLLAGTTGELNAALRASAPHLLETARAAVKLDPTIGSVAFVYESLAKGIKKNQPLLIDNANLIVSVGKANERFAAANHIAVESMNAEQKQMALLADTLRAGDVMLGQVGGTTESLVDPFSRLSAATANYTADLKRDFAPALSGTADKLAGLIENMRTADAVNREWHASGGIVNDVAANLAVRFELLREVLGGNNTAIDRYNKRLAENATVSALSAGQMADYAAMAAETSDSIDDLSESTADLAEVTMASRQAMNELQAVMKGALGEQLDKFAEQQETARQHVTELTSEIDVLASKNYLTAAQQEELDGLQAELVETRQHVLDDAAAHEEATHRILFGYMQQRLAIDGLTEDELAALQKVANQWGLLDDATYAAIAGIDAAADAVEDGSASWEAYISRVNRLDGALRGLPTSHTFTINSDYVSAEQYRGNVDYQPPAPPGGGGPGVQMAEGFEGVFNRPTTALFGEAGPEFVFAAPVSQLQNRAGGRGGGGATWNGDINITGVNDPQAVAAAVMGVLRERGIIAAHALR